MVNVNIRNKDIEQIKKQLHAAACQPPKEDYFSRNGRAAWEEYSSLCRGYESELKSMGVNL